jgi:RNA polymerase sigma factor (sigma-70 family)
MLTSQHKSQPHAALLDNHDPLTKEQLAELWVAYFADRGDIRLRNRLVEHYLPSVGAMAKSIARKLLIRDQENAVGEALASLVTRIVPRYDGKRNFDHWALLCVRRTLVDLRRRQRAHDEMFVDTPSGAGGDSPLDLAPGRDWRGFESRFLELTADLDHREATVLWMRYCREMRVVEIAEILKATPKCVDNWLRSAEGRLI